MGKPQRRLVLGVDAGGTKTAAWIAASQGVAANAIDAGKVLGRGDGGPGNPSRHGMEAAFNNVLETIRMAGAEAGVALNNLTAAVIGMAGAGTESIQREAAEYLRRQASLIHLSVIPDFKLVLPAAFPQGGIAIIAGTGSIVHGVRGADETRVGGHGYLVDDCGSGFWIGRQALQAIAYSLDGRGPDTALTENVCHLFQEKDPRNLAATIHASPERLRTIAAAAPLVVAAAGDGDTVAVDILDRAASELAGMIMAACHQLDYSHDEYSLAMAGSVLSKTHVVRENLLETLRREGIAPASSQIVTEPVRGAVQLAARALRV